jgi:hypothetical protein
MGMDSCWEVEVDRSSPAEWAQMLDLFNDASLYQTWAYGEVRWGAENLSHLVLKRDGEVCAIAQLRVVRPTRLDFGIAYLRWGPVFERRGRELDPAVSIAMARALETEYVVKRKLALRVIPNAFAGSPRAALFESAFPGFKGEAASAANTYRTVVLDLAPPIEQLRKKLDGKWRNMLVQAEKKGLTIATGSGTEEYRTFTRMYDEMKRRKGFQSTVDVEEFGRVQASLPESERIRIWICEEKGVPVAGVVASAIGDSGIYVLGATSDQGLTAKGGYLLQWNVVQWLKQNGRRWYDLGGIDPAGNPGVYRFKRGMSGTDVSQLSPMVACNSLLSSAILRAGFALQRAVRSGKGILQSARPLSPQVSRN